MAFSTLESNPVTVSAPETVSTPELVRRAVDEARELVQLEVALAVDEVRSDVERLKKVAILSSVSLVLANLLLATLVFAIVLSLGGTAAVAFGAAGVLALSLAVIAAITYKAYPGMPLKRTRERLKNDMNQLREHVT